MSVSSPYTFSERTVKKYTVYQAVESARRRLGVTFINRYGICTNALRGKQDSDKITLQELNEISDELVSDSKYYSWGK